MNSQSNASADGTQPPSEKEPWGDVLHRWLGWLGGLLFLVIGVVGLCSDGGMERLGPSLCYLAFGFVGLKDFLMWILELFEWRRGGRIMAVRIWMVPLIFVGPVLFLACGLAWLLGH
jgi:hypothetical protein